MAGMFTLGQRIVFKNPFGSSHGATGIIIGTPKKFSCNDGHSFIVQWDSRAGSETTSWKCFKELVSTEAFDIDEDIITTKQSHFDILCDVYLEEFKPLCEDSKFIELNTNLEIKPCPKCGRPPKLTITLFGKREGVKLNDECCLTIWCEFCKYETSYGDAGYKNDVLKLHQKVVEQWNQNVFEKQYNIRMMEKEDYSIFKLGQRVIVKSSANSRGFVSMRKGKMGLIVGVPENRDMHHRYLVYWDNPNAICDVSFERIVSLTSSVLDGMDIGMPYSICKNPNFSFIESDFLELVTDSNDKL